jgi:adrenodoxin-NADP+ reductase
MAVIGSGPAGFYTAYKVLAKIENSIVDMYEQLPVPFGLVRFGVAPDHPEVKVNCLLSRSGELKLMNLAELSR